MLCAVTKSQINYLIMKTFDQDNCKGIYKTLRLHNAVLRSSFALWWRVGKSLVKGSCVCLYCIKTESNSGNYIRKDKVVFQAIICFSFLPLCLVISTNNDLSLLDVMWPIRLFSCLGVGGEHKDMRCYGIDKLPWVRNLPLILLTSNY
jgi:hypothetical protein